MIHKQHFYIDAIGEAEKSANQINALQKSSEKVDAFLWSNLEQFKVEGDYDKQVMINMVGMAGRLYG
jgi:hypothetical protein